MMHFLMYAGIAASLAAVAFVAALLGMGGGTLYTPLQLFQLRLILLPRHVRPPPIVVSP